MGIQFWNEQHYPVPTAWLNMQAHIIYSLLRQSGQTQEVRF